MAKVSYSEALSQPKQAKPGPKMLRSIEVSKAENGGHIVEHRFENNGPGYHSPEQHVFGANEGQKLVAHMSKHMGIKMKGAEAEE